MHALLCVAAQVMADVASFTGAATVSLMLVSKFIFQVRSSHQQLHPVTQLCCFL
jgi:hypothetical protein